MNYYSLDDISLDRVALPISQMLYWRNQHEVWRWCRQNVLISDQDQRSWAERLANDRSIHMLGIKWRGEWCGVCGLTSIDPIHRKAEFSLYIAPEYQGKGHGVKALKLLLKYGFESLNLNRIWGEVLEGNPALDKFLGLGFKREGECVQTYWKQNRFWNSILIGFLAEDYTKVRDQWFSQS